MNSMAYIPAMPGSHHITNPQLHKKLLNLQVVSLMIREIGSFQPQFIRPYETYFDDRTANVLHDRLDRRRASGKITPAVFHGISGQIMAPTTNPQAHAYIDNGWQQPRLAFFLRVLAKYEGFQPHIHNIQGYTDYDGISPSGYIDTERMVFYINSITSAQEMVEESPFGSIAPMRVFDKFQVISDPSFSGIPSTQQIHLIRPSDVIGGVQVAYDLMSSESPYAINPLSVVDTRTAPGGRVQESSRENNIPSHWLSSVLQQYTSACRDASVSESNADIYDDAYERARESRMGQNPFIVSLMGVQSQNLSTDRFTWHDLVAVDPSLRTALTDDSDHRVQVIRGAQVFRFKIGDNDAMRPCSAENSMSWGGRDLSTIAVVSLANEVTAIMADCQLEYVDFWITNDTLGSHPYFEMPVARSFSQMRDMTAQYLRFEQSIINGPFATLSMSNERKLFIHGCFDMFGGSLIRLKIDNEPIEEWQAPTFADRNSSPIVTINSEHKSNLLNHIGHMFNVAKETLCPTTYVEPNFGVGFHPPGIHTNAISGSAGIIDI